MVVIIDKSPRYRHLEFAKFLDHPRQAPGAQANESKVAITQFETTLFEYIENFQKTSQKDCIFE